MIRPAACAEAQHIGGQLPVAGVEVNELACDRRPRVSVFTPDSKAFTNDWIRGNRREGKAALFGEEEGRLENDPFPGDHADPYWHQKLTW